MCDLSDSADGNDGIAQPIEFDFVTLMNGLMWVPGSQECAFIGG